MKIPRNPNSQPKRKKSPCFWVMLSPQQKHVLKSLMQRFYARSTATSRATGGSCRNSTKRPTTRLWWTAAGCYRPTNPPPASNSGLSRKPTARAPASCCLRNIEAYGYSVAVAMSRLLRDWLHSVAFRSEESCSKNFEVGRIQTNSPLPALSRPVRM